VRRQASAAAVGGRRTAPATGSAARRRPSSAPQREAVCLARVAVKRPAAAVPARARKRRQPVTTLSPRLVSASSPSLLEQHTVADQSDYLRRCRELVTFVETKGLPFNSPEDHEVALLSFFDHEFLRGRSVPDGTKMWAAFTHVMPQYGRFGNTRLPRVNRALQGWLRLAPPGVRLPLPEEGVSAMAVLMARAGRRDLGLLTLLAMDAYLRPGEAVGLRVRSLIPAAPHLGYPYNITALLLAPRVGGVPTKTRDFDESVLLDSPHRRWMNGELERLAARKPPEALLFDTDMKEWDKAFRSAALQAGLSVLRPCLYMLRHTGSSSDALNARRTELGIKSRGRWQRDKTVRKYEKHARSLYQMSELDAKSQLFALNCHAHLGEWLGAPHLAPAGPHA
jgi:hypothetical protein